MYGSVTSNDYIVVLMVLELHLSGISVVVSLLDKWIDRKGCIEVMGHYIWSSMCVLTRESLNK